MILIIMFVDVVVLVVLILKITFLSSGVIRKCVLEELISYSLHLNGKIIVLRICSILYWGSLPI